MRWQKNARAKTPRSPQCAIRRIGVRVVLTDLFGRIESRELITGFSENLAGTRDSIPVVGFDVRHRGP